jgi:lysophospholipase L1-like esterase
MKTIFVYGDSNTWGYVPGEGTRFPLEQRWTNIASKKLGPDYTFVVEALNGRTTVFDDPYSPYRNGSYAFSMLLHSHYPIDLVVLMLGSNDLKDFFHNTPQSISWGVTTLVKLVKGFEWGPNGKDPKILILAPPLVEAGDQAQTPFDLREFTGAHEKSKELAREYKKVALENDCYFLDTAPIAHPSPIDGLHLTVESNKALGEWIAGEIAKLDF